MGKFESLRMLHKGGVKVVSCFGVAVFPTITEKYEVVVDVSKNTRDLAAWKIVGNNQVAPLDRKISPNTGVYSGACWYILVYIFDSLNQGKI